MKILSVETWQEDIRLTRPYSIATRSLETVPIFFIEVRTDRHVGHGAGSPEKGVTGEGPEEARSFFDGPAIQDIRGKDVSPELIQSLQFNKSKTPAGLAALDMALWDLLAKEKGVPLVELWGRVYASLPTSITIGIKNVEETLVESQEYYERGFRVFKVKLGPEHGINIERLVKLREAFGGEVRLRVDMNQAYDVATLESFDAEVKSLRLDLEFYEQPLPDGPLDPYRRLHDDVKRHVMIDETLKTLEDAAALVQEPKACGMANIKLMKSGGVTEGRNIAHLLARHDMPLMWGCMDESRVSIAASLHAAYSCAKTGFLDLDGHLDLESDPFAGGFTLKKGCLETLDRPGLGVTRL